MIGLALRVGLTRGDDAVGFVEIEAWSRIARTPLALWTCESVRSVAAAFTVARHEHKDEDAFPPWLPSGKAEELAAKLAEFDRDFGAVLDNTPSKPRH